jgi:hypothetical protein
MATKEPKGTTHRFDPTFTRNVISAIGPKATPRAKQVIGSLIQHLHDFARENEITVDEWMSAVNFVGIETSRSKMPMLIIDPLR